MALISNPLGGAFCCQSARPLWTLLKLAIAATKYVRAQFGVMPNWGILSAVIARPLDGRFGSSYFAQPFLDVDSGPHCMEGRARAGRQRPRRARHQSSRPSGAASSGRSGPSSTQAGGHAHAAQQCYPDRSRYNATWWRGSWRELAPVSPIAGGVSRWPPRMPNTARPLRPYTPPQKGTGRHPAYSSPPLVGSPAGARNPSGFSRVRLTGQGRVSVRLLAE